MNNNKIINGLPFHMAYTNVCRVTECVDNQHKPFSFMIHLQRFSLIWAFFVYVVFCVALVWP